MNDRSVVLVRHGEVENPEHLVYGDLAGFGLSRLGRRQARAVGERLAELDVVAIYSSPLQRAMETAAAVSAAHQLAITTDRELIEWRLSDVWKGEKWDDVPSDQLEAYLEHPWDLEFNPEPLTQLGERMRTAIDGHRARHRDGVVVFVSHQDPIQAARLVLTGRSLTELNASKPEHGEAFFFTEGTPRAEAWRWAPDQSGETHPDADWTS